MSEGDQLVPKGDDYSFPVNLNFSLPFYGKIFNSLYININGYILFDTNYSSYYHPPFDFTHAVTPFCSDLYTQTGGNIYYKQIKNETILKLIGDEINNSTNKTSFLPNNSFTITYDSVRAYPGISNRNVSFQIIFSTDSNQSYVTLNYGRLDFEPNETSSIQFNALGFFNKYFFTNLKSSSNVDLAGKWIFNLVVYGIHLFFFN